MKRNFFKRNYACCWDFFIESKWHIVFTLGLFCLTFLVGFVYPFLFREEIINLIVRLTEMLEGKNALELIWLIFSNNIRSSFFAMILGVIFGIFPLITLVINGYLLGFVSREAASQEGIIVLWQLLPHGIFELPAIILSVGIGIKIGLNLFNGKLKYNFVEGLRFFAFVIFPLLLVAGIIEGLLIGSLA